MSGLNAAFNDIADRITSGSRFPPVHRRRHLHRAGDGVPVDRVSLTAAVTTILSAFVGFGVLTLVVQEGHLLGLTGLDQHRPDRDLRAADRVRDSLRALDGLHGLPDEPHPRGARHGLDTRAAVEHGIAAIGRVVVAAALIMGTVFAAFILNTDRIPRSSESCWRWRSSRTH